MVLYPPWNKPVRMRVLYSCRVREADHPAIRRLVANQRVVLAGWLARALYAAGKAVPEKA